MSIRFKSIVGVLLFSGVILVSQAAELKTQQQRFSYALGFQFAQQLKAQGVKVDAIPFAEGIDDVLKEQKLQLSLEEISSVMQEQREAMVREQNEQAQKALEAGKKFLEKNKSRKGVVVLPSGLQYIVLKEGKGASPAVDATVTIHYRGTLINGEEFDSSYGRGEPTSFSLTGVIPGFQEALTRMQEGSKWRVFIPAELAYGEKGAGSKVGPNETLLFEIELLSTKALETPEAAQ